MYACAQQCRPADTHVGTADKQEEWGPRCSCYEEMHVALQEEMQGEDLDSNDPCVPSVPNLAFPFPAVEQG